MPDALLTVEDLKTHFFTEAGVVRAVDGVSFELNAHEPLGLVGESGSGKTITALSILGIVPRPGKIVGGKIIFGGENLIGKSEDEMRKIRGRKISYVTQDPNSSLNPLQTVGSQLGEVIRTHSGVDKNEAFNRGVKILEMVRISEPKARMRAYPHELSGGMRQRIAIARALAGEPDILIADEPSTNLDVTIQAQLLELLKTLEKDLDMNVIMITHDMGVIAETTKKVVVLYAGMVAEIGDTRSIFYEPKHPYTVALLKAVPRIDRKKSLEPIGGNIPNLITPPSGCRFHPRCPYATSICEEQVPPMEQAGKSMVACHHWKKLAFGKEAAQ